MPSQLVNTCSKALAEMKYTIAFAESATAGRLASEFALTENSGSVLKGGLVCYDACIKEDILGISPDFVEKYTPESAEVTREMAAGLDQFIKADIYIANTGLTTPGGSETPEKPVGTMFLHIIINGKHVAVRRVFKGTPEEIILQTTDLAAETILGELQLINQPLQTQN